jgi:hypothetical protein
VTDEFRPFALLVQRIREPRTWQDREDAVDEVVGVLERISPLAKTVLDAIEADNRDAVLVIGEPGRKRYLTVSEALRALEFMLMRGLPRERHSQGKEK